MKQQIDPTLHARMYTKSKYAKDFGISRGTLDNRIKRGEIETIEVKGGTIVLAADK
jgi:DNA-binding Xre family transcriptional regulator